MEAQGDMSMDEDFPITLQKESSKPKKRRTADWLTCMESDCVDAFSRDSNSIKEARAHYFTTHSWDWDHSNTEDLSDIFKEPAQEAGLLVSLFLKYNGHGRGWNIYSRSIMFSSLNPRGSNS